MDYTKSPLRFRIKKALRYTSLYGPRRTLAKIKGQYHMRRRFETLPPNRTGHPRQSARVGLIGCGNFAFSNIAYYLAKSYGPVIRGVMDLNVHRAASLCREYGCHYYTADAQEVLNDPDIDLIFVASNHASHAEYAIEALNQDKCVHIEKPHVISEDQLDRLCRAMSRSKGRVGLGFNRPKSRIGKLIKQHLDSQEGPAMLNWFIAGHEIPPDHWYFKPEEGGRVLGNLCHWTDFVYCMLPEGVRFPVTITPTRHQKSDCDIAVSYLFPDGSIAAITFSAKGHIFEGVKERFAAHRGNLLLYMDDFKKMVAEISDRKSVFSPWFRDHGHQTAIRQSYELLQGGAGCSLEHVSETAQLFLKTKQALEENRPLTVPAANISERASAG